jgi:hypothetical protein
MAIPIAETSIETDIAERCDQQWYTKCPIPGQQYVVFSCCSTGALPVGLKIYGTFSSRDEANDFSKKVSSKCDFFDVYVASTNEWLSVPPKLSHIEDVHYQNDKLNAMRNSIIALREGSAAAMKQQIERDQEIKRKALLN